MKNNLLPIAKEGWSYIGYSVASLIIFSILDLDFFQLVSYVFVVFFLFVFRNPERELPHFEQSSVLCPVDGEVISIDTLNDSEYAYKVTIDTGYKDVGILRVPMNGTVLSYRKMNGTRLSLEESQVLKTNENISIIFEDSNENKVEVLHTVKQSLCGVHADLTEGSTVAQSARYGLMVNGRTELFLPQNFRLSLIIGEETTASESLVGYFS